MNITYSTNVSEEVNCTISSDVDGIHGIIANNMTLCLNIDIDGVHTLTRDLPSDIVIGKHGRESPSSDESTRLNLSVLITDPEMGDVYLECCYSNETDTIIVGESYLFIQVSNENNLEGKILIIKFSVHFDLTT